MILTYQKVMIFTLIKGFIQFSRRAGNLYIFLLVMIPKDWRVEKTLAGKIFMLFNDHVKKKAVVPPKKR